MKYVFNLAAMGVILCASVVQAAVWMPSVFSDHMVLQREKLVPVWGCAAPGTTITVEFAGNKQTASADNEGKWMVKLPAMKASKNGRTMTVTAADGTRKTTFKDVLVGEVWLASGQSNMEVEVKRSKKAAEVISRANYPMIRLIHVPRNSTVVPAYDVPATWTPCTPTTAAGFSAVAFFFGERLYTDLDVPIGLISSSYSGSKIQVWTPKEGFEMFDSLSKEAVNIAKTVTPKRLAVEMQVAENQRQWASAAKIAMADGKPLPPYPKLPASAKAHTKQPAGLFNGMIAPLIPYAFRGAIWYQGESNGQDGMVYRDRMEALITTWRNRWGGEDFPFYFVQICPYYQAHGLQFLWTAQLATTKLPNTALAGTADIGDIAGLHPDNKFEVGNRLALCALAKDYGKSVAYSGPIFKAVTFDGNQAVVTFDHVADGLKSLDGKPLTYLMLSGKEKVFYNAEAKIDGDKLILTSKEVPHPVAVRYGWAGTAIPNLGNSAGLPAIAFRTDKWSRILSSPRIGPWYVYCGTWSEKDGVFTQSNKRVQGRLQLGFKDWTDYTLELDVKVTEDHPAGRILIHFRENQYGSYHISWNNSDIRLNAARDLPVKLLREKETWYTLKIVVKGNTIKVLVDGKSVMSYTDPKPRAPKNGGISRWENSS